MIWETQEEKRGGNDTLNAAAAGGICVSSKEEQRLRRGHLTLELFFLKQMATHPNCSLAYRGIGSRLAYLLLWGEELGEGNF